MTKTHINNEHARFERAQIRAEDFANKNFADFNRQIMLFVAILLPLSSFVLTSESLLDSLGCFDKLLISTTWVFLALSFLAGSWQFVEDVNFWGKRAVGYYEVIGEVKKKEGLTHENVESNIKNIVNKKVGKLPIKSNDLYIKFSFLLLFIGLFSLVFFMLRILFM